MGWYCRWCGKHRKGKAKREQKSITSGEWMALCPYCDRKRRNLARNPFAGLIKMEIRTLKS